MEEANGAAAFPALESSPMGAESAWLCAPRGPLVGSPSAATPGHRQSKGAGSGLSVVLQYKQEGSSGGNQQPRVTAHHRGRVNGPPDCAPQLPGRRSLNRDPLPQPHLLNAGTQRELRISSGQSPHSQAGVPAVYTVCAGNFEFQGGSAHYGPRAGDRAG